MSEDAIKLSTIVGQDAAALQTSYRQLVRTHFATLRTIANDYIDNRFAPTYLQEFIRTGQLVERAKVDDPKKVLQLVHEWAQKAIETIEANRRQLLEPIDRDERELLKVVDEAFERLIQANAAVTAHLESLKGVTDLQNDVLDSLKLGDLRTKLTDAMTKASDRADAALRKLEAAKP